MKKIPVIILCVILVAFSMNINAQTTEVQKEDAPKEVFVPYDTPPQLTTELDIIYPDSAKNVDLEGTVIVMAFINSEGQVTHVKIKDGQGIQGLNDAAIESIKESEWTPAMDEEAPVGVWVSIPVKFTLEGE